MLNTLAMSVQTNAAAAAAAAPTPTEFKIGAGMGLIVLGLTAQFLIHKRLKNAKVSKFYSWIAWSGALLGGIAATTGISESLPGISGFGAFIAASVMLLFIGVDLADRRPDWLAFILIVFCPTFMRLSSGPVGKLFHGILAVGDKLVDVVAGALGA